VAVLLQRCRNAESSIMRHEERVRAAAEEAAERLGRCATPRFDSNLLLKALLRLCLDAMGAHPICLYPTECSVGYRVGRRALIAAGSAPRQSSHL
jgi:hypothetical protein